MGTLSLLALAFALAMDAFAVAVTAGVLIEPLTARPVFRLSFHFGLFQALMPVLGWSLGRAVYEHIAAFDHFVAFGLLAGVGAKMLKDGLSVREEERLPCDPSSGATMICLSLATSIDALAAGLSLAFLGEGIWVPALVIGAVAATMTAAGMMLGRRLGDLWGKRVEILGGVVLISLGVKIVIEHVWLS